MNRRTFVKQSILATSGSIALPYILPSGRLFAKSGSQMAEHVVLVMFAGGVRQQESILQRYLDDSQGVGVEGNIMYNILEGNAPESKIVYGTNGNLEGENPIEKVVSETLQKQGTLFKEVSCSSVGHYHGLNSILQGKTDATQGLRDRPVNPTIFEYVRRHLGTPATKVWFAGNGIGNSVPLLNYSNHANYGANYGANFLAPTITFNENGFEHLSDAKIYHPENELEPIYKMKLFLDNNFRNVAHTIGGLQNTDEEKNDIKEFINYLFEQTEADLITKPNVYDNNDLETISYTCELLSWFKPTLTVVNLHNVDGCHSNFTSYLRSLHRADHGVGFLWNHIQSIPEMANNTVMMVIPEHGRNDEPNPIKDENDWYAYDHSDANSKRIFSLMVGKGVDANLTVGSESNQVGYIEDCVLTIGDILGIKSDISSAGMVSGSSQSFFDRI